MPIPHSALPDSKGLEIIHRQKAEYPIEAERDGIQGEVMVKVQVSEQGEVENVEVLSGDPVLTDAAVKAAKKFKFKPFIRKGEPVKVATKLPFDFYLSDRMTNTKVPEESNKTQASGTAGPATGSPKRILVSKGVMAGKLIRKVAPVYPLEAKHNYIQGTVVLRAVIGEDGRIKDLSAVSGPKALIPASIGAVQQWEYRPYLLMGEPVEVETQITINFTLAIL